MSNTQQQATATIRLIGQYMDNSEVPAAILVRTLTGLQQLIYLFAASSEEQNIGQRFRVSDKIKQLYTLHCQIPQSGSYAIPTVLKPALDSQLSLFPEFEHQLWVDKYNPLMQNLEHFFLDLSNSKLDQIHEILPDSKLRYRVLLEVKKFLPKAESGWKLGFSSLNNSEIIITNKATIEIDKLLNQDEAEDTVMTVTGELIRIDFDKHIIFLRYPPTHREIECIYREELEDVLVEKRRGNIQVTGQFTVDAEGHPIKITDVTRIEAVELDSIIIKEVELSASTLVFKTPLQLVPTMDEDTKQLFVVDKPEISLNVFAYTREELIAEINDQIAFLWEEYALAEVSDLSEGAQQLRDNLLAQIEEVKNAATKG